MSQVEYDEVGHFVRVPASLGDTEVRMLFDSGIGVTVVDAATAAATGAVELGTTMSGRRMSGQLVTAPLVRLPRLTVGAFSVRDHVAGVIDLAESGESGSALAFDGILGLDLFTQQAVTVDPGTRRLTIGPGPADGLAVEVEVRRDGHSVTVFAPLRLPSGRIVSVEVDTGSGALILDESLMPDCAVATDDPRIDRHEGVDETGHRFTRRFVTIDGAVGIPGEPATSQPRPRVMFQDIIHEGLVGTDYLNRFAYAFDVAAGRLVLREPSTATRS